jgi:hypothetical protein
MTITLRITDSAGQTRAENRAGSEVALVYNADYAEGDCVAISAPEGSWLWLSLDDAMAPALVWLKGGSYSLPVPFGPRCKTYSPRAFTGKLHRLQARLARTEEIALRRDLALNPYDDHTNTTLFPHASANVETRGEAVFAARNAIDGEIANDDHGFWPYTSWGIAQDPKAALTLDFGRPVLVDEIALTLRADFPHDAWWVAAHVTFGPGDTERLTLSKSATRQTFAITPREITCLTLHDLIKADDPSPFPALTRIEVMGTDAHV